jgi:translocation and assembly module TamB
MSRTKKIIRSALIAAGALVALLIVAVLVVPRTDRFRNYVRNQIVKATEDSTGGRVEVGSFDFDLSRMRALVTGFVIHGNEPAGAAPFLSIAKVEVQIHLLRSPGHPFDIAYLGVEAPRANIMVLSGGRTNIPTPKVRSTSDKSGLETLVDLEIGRFQLTNGLLAFESLKQPMNVQGNNLRAQLAYNIRSDNYRGTLSMEPIYAVAGRNTPVTARVTLPVTLGRDRVDIRQASIATQASTILIDASVEKMRDPKASAHISGHIATADLKNGGDLPIDVNARNAPAQIDLDANAIVGSQVIQVSGLRVGLGHSVIEASGALKGAGRNGALTFRTRFALGELGRLVNKTIKPDSMVALDGRASMDEHNLRVTDMRLTAFGAEVDGSVSLEDFARYKLNANLRPFDIQTALRMMNQKLPYQGVISGSFSAAGDTKIAGTKSVTAQARMNIAPNGGRVPVSGRLNADYNGAADDVSVLDSFLALPHSRLNLNGSLSQTLNVAFNTRDLGDLLAAVPAKSAPPITLNQGSITFDGAVTGGMSTPNITGRLVANKFAVEGRQFDTLAADVAATGSGASIRNGTLTRAGTGRPEAMQVQFAAAAGLRNWAATPRSPLSANLQVRNADLADVLALAGRPPAGYSGPLTVTANIGGTVGNPQGGAAVDVGAGAIEEEPFDRAQIQVNLADQLVTIPTAYIKSGAGQANLTAEYRHPRESFTTGSLHAHLETNQMNLAAIRTAQKEQPDTSGRVQVAADATAEKNAGDFLLTAVNADISAAALRLKGQYYGDINATARTNNQTVTYNLTSNLAGGSIRVNGNTRLVADYPTNADASIANLTIERALVLAARPDIPARGVLSANAHVSGTIKDPQADAALNLTRAVISDEPIDRAQLRVAYRADSVNVPQFEIVAGSAHINLTARYNHPAGDLQRGSAQFSINSSPIDLTRIRNVQKVRPGMGGTVEISANGDAAVRPGTPRILLSSLNARVAGSRIASQGKNLGNLTFTANTTSGNRLNFALDSNLADAAIHGSGDAQLTGDYPVNAQVTFNNVLYTHLQALLGTTTTASPGFEGATEGRISVSGPVLKTDQMRGELQLTKLSLTTLPQPGAGKSVTIANDGPIGVSLDAGTVRIQRAHLTGPQTNIQAEGSASERTMNLNLNAAVDLSLLPDFSRVIDSTGKIALAAQVRGSMAKPLVNGQLQLQNASVNYRGVENGLSNANGVIAFNGNTARVQNLTAESGGGKISVTGFVGFVNVVRFALRANADKIRVRSPQGASVVASAEIRLSGTTENSNVTGTVTINQMTYNPQSDIGSMLTRAAPPVQSASTPSPMLENMKLDIRVHTLTGLTVQAALARNLRADVDLRVRGSAATPGVVGRVTISEGQLVFFGATYTVDRGSIGFYNPLRIDPVLDLTLETQAKTVTVTLRVTGPIDNMNLSYTSDPPLQFQEIVGLLASGKTPTSDPTLLANQPPAPEQSVQQMGESAILGKAVADPVSSRLERVFGVTQFKIDPSFSSGSDVPTARLTLQQQITHNLTFTYTSALDDPNGQIVKIEWAFSPQWAAVANRDQNGIFSINFLYKRQFR